MYVWVICMNALGAKLMVKDKMNAINHEWRVKEKYLFVVAFLGGSLGILAAMKAVRHKTRKFFFYMGVPMLAWWNVMAVAVLTYFLI